MYMCCLILQVEKNLNNMTIKIPHQLFINGEFVDAEGQKTYKTINPTDGTVRDVTDSLCLYVLFKANTCLRFFLASRKPVMVAVAIDW